MIKKYTQIKSGIKKWYAGEFYENEPFTQVVRVGRRRPKLVLKIEKLKKWIKKNANAIAVGVISGLIILAFT